MERKEAAGEFYRTTLYNGKTAGYYMNCLPAYPEEEDDYMTVTLPVDDAAGARTLRGWGFHFRERSIPMEISLGRFRPPLDMGKKLACVTVEDWSPDDIFRVAKGRFSGDLRFTLVSTHPDALMEDDLLYRFIVDRKRQGLVATILSRDGQAEGFNLWRMDDGSGRVMLGAVSERYQGTGAALTVYSHTAQAMKERGAVALRDIIASSNTASLNLHAILARCAGGAFRFGSCQDCYRKESP